MSKERRNYDQISLIDITTFDERDLERVQELSNLPVLNVNSIGSLCPEDRENVDCLVISLLQTIDEETFSSFPKLRRVVVYGSSTRRIDMEAASKRDISVVMTKGYCDVETAEFCLTIILNYFRGLLKAGPNSACTVSGKVIGIIGFGNVGKQLFNKLESLNVSRKIYSRSFSQEKPELVTIDELLHKADAVSVHVPPDTELTDFFQFGSTSQCHLIVNTSLGISLPIKGIENWLKEDSRNVIVFDQTIDKKYQRLCDTNKRAIKIPQFAYKTEGSIRTLINSTIANIRN